MLKPLRDNIVLEKLPEEEVSGVIVAPTSSKETPQKAKVLSVGDKVVDVSEGDIVVYKKFSTTEVDKLLIISEEDVLCIEK